MEHYIELGNFTNYLRTREYQSDTSGIRKINILHQASRYKDGVITVCGAEQLPVATVLGTCTIIWTI